MPDINLKVQIEAETLKKKLNVKDGKTPTSEELTELIKPLIPKPIIGGRGDKGIKGDKGNDGKNGQNGKNGADGFNGIAGKDGIDKEPETGDSIIEKINPLKNVLNFQVLRNVPDFVLFKDLPSRGGDQGGGGGSIVTFRDSTAARISAYVTDLQFGTGLNTSYSNGKITITGASQGVTSVASADGSITVTNPTTTPDLSVVQAPKLTTARTISITGDLAYTSASFDGSANVTGTGTLATVNNNVGTFGTASSVGTFTVNGKGLITAASSTSIQITESQVTNLVSDLAGKQATGNYITALTGDGTASGPGSVAFTLATVNGNVGTFGSATQSTQITVNGKGLITAIANVTVTPAVGSITGLGTGVATALGVNVGSAGAFITFNGNAGTPSALVGTNISGTAANLTAGTVTTNANLTGDVTSVGNATTIGTAKVTLAMMANMATSSLIYRKTAGTGVPEVNTLATLKTDLLLTGTNSGDQTITLTGGVTGSGTGSFAATVITNANLTGPITSVGNATSIASQTGTGTKFVVDTSPTIVTPTISGNMTMSTSAAKILVTSLVITDASANTRGTLRVMPNGTVAAVPAALQFFGTDFSADPTNYEALSIFSKGSSDTSYIIRIEKGGTGTVRPLYIYTDPNTSQLVLNTSGNVGIGTATTPSQLTVAGLINMKNYTVATLPAGTRGDVAYCTDLLTPTFLVAIVGGGTTVGPVFYNGTAWVSF